MSFNAYAPLSLNGIVHQAPPGFEDSYFAYVLNPPQQYFQTTAYMIYISQQGQLQTSGLQLTALASGAAGNLISFQVVQGSGGSTTVAVNANAITVTLKAAGDTMSGVATVLNASGPVTALISIITLIGTAPAPVLPLTFLSGGGTSSGLVLATSGLAGSRQTGSFVTHADSLFVAYGIEIPITILNTLSQTMIGFRIRWNNEFLTEDYIYASTVFPQVSSGQAPGGPQGNPMALFPIFPAKILPPQSLLNVDLVNASTGANGGSTIYNYPLTLVGYKRRKLSQ